jgi:lipopolysaccharide biosynthesis glycosyltransferase
VFFLLITLLFGEKIFKKVKNSIRGNMVWGTPDVEKNTVDAIAVIVSTDDGYALQTLVTLTSLLDNAYDDTFYKINILVPSKFTDENKNKILTLQNIYKKNCDIEFINMKDCFTNSYISKHFTEVVYYRLRAPSILKTRKKCIYMDVDIIVKKDLSYVYNCDLQGKWVAGVADAVRSFKNEEEKQKREVYKKQIGIGTLEEYINSGFLILDLESLRKNNVEDKFKSFLEKHKDPAQHDQTTINVVCFGNIFTLPFEYNTQMYMFSVKPYGEDEKKISTIFKKEEWEKAWKDPTIIHFAGEKPWKDPSVYFVEEWWKIARKTLYWEEISKKYRVSQ